MKKMCKMGIWFEVVLMSSSFFVVDADWVAGSSPFTKGEATGDTESISSKSEDGGDEGEEITEFFSYDRLKSTSTDPTPKINIKRKEVRTKPSPSVELISDCHHHCLLKTSYQGPACLCDER